MRVFTLQNNVVVIEPEILAIPAFNKLYKRDRTKDKTTSFNELAYIYHVCDWNSPYRNYTNIDERKERVKNSYFKEDKWKEDKEVQEAMDVYVELTKTPLMGLLEDSYYLIEVLRKYFRNATVDNIKSADAMTSIEKLGKAVESMRKLEEMVQAEKYSSTKVRGQKTVGYDER